MTLNKNDPRERARALIGELRASGLKVTEQRVLVLEELAGDGTHPTALELFTRIKRLSPRISFATVYNTLNALERARRIAAVDLGGARRFDPNRARHDHAICDRCGAVRDVDPVEAPRMPVLEDYAVTRVERVYRGLCDDCGASSENDVQEK